MNIYLDIKKNPLALVNPSLQSILGDIIPIHAQIKNKLNTVLHLEFANTSNLANIIHNLYRELSEKTLGYEDTLHHYFELFIIEICRKAQSKGPLKKGDALKISKSNQKMASIVQYLNLNFAHKITLPQLATLSELSQTHLQRSFKEYTGKTLIQFLNELRIQKALQQIISTNQSMRAIAYDCGYVDQTFFNRQFKKLIGESPRDYLKKWDRVGRSFDKN